MRRMTCMLVMFFCLFLNSCALGPRVILSKPLFHHTSFSDHGVGPMLLHQNLVQLVFISSKGETSELTGTLIQGGCGKILTAAHGLSFESGSPISYILVRHPDFTDDIRFIAESLSVDLVDDIAYLQIVGSVDYKGYNQMSFFDGVKVWFESVRDDKNFFVQSYDCHDVRFLGAIVSDTIPDTKHFELEGFTSREYVYMDGEHFSYSEFSYTFFHNFLLHTYWRFVHRKSWDGHQSVQQFLRDPRNLILVVPRGAVYMHGLSGGPVFYEGKIVGIMSSGFVINQNQCILVVKKII